MGAWIDPWTNQETEAWTRSPVWGVQMALHPPLSQCSPSQPTPRVPWAWTEAEVPRGRAAPLAVMPGDLSYPGIV